MNFFLKTVVILIMPVVAIAQDRVIDIVERIKKDDLYNLEVCAAEGNLSCKRDLGVYLYFGDKTSNKTEKKDNIKKAEQLLKESTGDPVSRFSLGIIYLNEKREIKKGEVMLLSSCYGGSSNACSYLYNKYSKTESDGFECPEKSCYNLEAVSRKIIELTKKDSSLIKDEKERMLDKYEINLAEILLKGKKEESIKILEDAVARDVTWSTTILAPVYAKGELVPKDLVRAYMLYDLSGTGYADDKAKVAEEMTPAQIQQAKEMSWRWQDEHRSYRPGYRDSDMGVQWQGVRYH